MTSGKVYFCETLLTASGISKGVFDEDIIQRYAPGLVLGEGKQGKKRRVRKILLPHAGRLGKMGMVRYLPS